MLVPGLMQCPLLRYAETVIYRMFYALDRTMTGRLTLRDLRRCVQPAHLPSLGTLASENNGRA